MSSMRQNLGSHPIMLGSYSWTSRTERNISTVFRKPSLWEYLLQLPKWTKTAPIPLPFNCSPSRLAFCLSHSMKPLSWQELSSVPRQRLCSPGSAQCPLSPCNHCLHGSSHSSHSKFCQVAFSDRNGKNCGAGLLLVRHCQSL